MVKDASGEESQPAELLQRERGLPAVLRAWMKHGYGHGCVLEAKALPEKPFSYIPPQ
ncbi:hypothetical protein [Qipengyuania aquimaris]|uniref:hypothetical protein n=1 Tax=Qipengyuania aquimaris TaxID=255984 RepID=UPI001CD43B9F|nr:hypothetical protein [Qipengyuania aquimaris]MCA0903229.1 hypothetical protein [Qipengyuania aquimaris]